MKINDSLKIKLLTLLSLTLLSIILLFTSFRLIFRITNTFIYLTGLITLFIGSILGVIAIWIFIFKCLFGRKKYNYNHYLDKVIDIKYLICLWLFLMLLILLFVYLK